MEDFYIMKKRNKIVAFLLAGVIAAGHGSVVYAAGYGSVVYEDVAWDLCALNEERMKLEVQEKNTDNDAAGNDQADIEERESPQSTSEYADIGIASVLNYVNLRAEPSVESEALGKLYNNSAATVLETVLDEAGEEWYLVSSGSVENAYVKAEYVKVGVLYFVFTDNCCRLYIALHFCVPDKFHLHLYLIFSDFRNAYIQIIRRNRHTGKTPSLFQFPLRKHFLFPLFWRICFSCFFYYNTTFSTGTFPAAGRI